MCQLMLCVCVQACIQTVSCVVLATTASALAWTVWRSTCSRDTWTLSTSGGETIVSNYVCTVERHISTLYRYWRASLTMH